MLEPPPDVPDGALAACLRAAWDLPVAELAFLPLGADINTAVYRAVAADGAPWFVKLRRGAVDEAPIVVPRLLADHGNAHVIPPRPAADGRLWARLGDYTVLLSPFIAGRDGVAKPLTDAQLAELGGVLRELHALGLPPEIERQLPRETFDPRVREQVRALQARAERETWAEPSAAGAAEVLRAERPTIDWLIERAEQLAGELQARPLEFVPCHADIHAFNVLAGDDGALYVVDWDTLAIAPKERDLMFIGAGIGAVWTSAREADAFYRGYGPHEVDAAALAYFRYERIVQDIAAYCEQLLLTDEGGADRPQGLRFLASNFLPDGTIALARREDVAG